MNKSLAVVIAGALALLAPSAAHATVDFNAYLSSSSNTYTVMGVDSTLIFRITNNSPASTEAMNNVILDFSTNVSDVISVAGGTWGWTKDLVKKSKVTLTAPSCNASDLIQPGAYLEFVVHVMQVQGAANLTDTFSGVDTNKLTGPAGCRPIKSTNANTPLPSWSLNGLEASVVATPSSVITGGTITATMTVTNRSSAAQNTVAPSMSVVSAGGGACTLSSPSPATLNLAADVSGEFVYTCTATSAQGTVAFRGSATNGTVSSAAIDSQPVAIGNLTASLAVLPTGVTSGSTVTVTMQVTNGGSTTITNVVPTGACSAPGYLCTPGTAAATYASGPTPSSWATLLPGNTAAFTWIYTITGTVGQTYYFNGYATADGPVQTNTATSGTGSISSITVTSAPPSSLRNSTNQTYTWTVTNTGSLGIDQVTITSPSSAIFQTPSSAATLTCGPTPTCTNAWTRGTNTATVVAWSTANAACQIKTGATTCDFPWTFALVGNATTPASTTDYSFRADLRDTVPVTTTKYTNVQVVVPPPTPPGDVTVNTAASNNASVMLSWTNPSSRHDGVIVLRTGIAGTCAVPDTSPTDGTEYTAGNTIGNATVVYADKNNSMVSTYQNTGLTNGWQYCYKVFNHDSSFIYAPGIAQPNGVKGYPTPGTEPNPLWSYSIGAATAMTPTTYANVGIFTSSNLGYISGLNVTNGGEQWRPVDVGGVVQGKMTVVNLTTGGNPRYIFTGAANGYAYAINAATGGVAWSYNVGSPILAPPVVHLRTNATTTFKGLYSNDLVYVVTRDSAARSANKVVALDALTGAFKWSFSGGGFGLDMINAAPGLDFYHDKLFVSSYSGAVPNSQPSFWVLDLVSNGARLASKSLGDIDASPTFSGTQRAYVSVPTMSGIIYSYNTSDYSERWPGGFDTLVGAGKSFSQLQRTNDGFVVTSGTAGKVWRITDNGSSASLYLGWATNPLTGVTGASQALVLTPNDVIYVGSSDGKLHSYALSTGASQFYKTLGTAGTAVGSPAGDSSGGGFQIVVGTGGGIIYKFTMPFTGNL